MKKSVTTVILFLCMILASQIYAQTPNLNIDGFQYEINHTGSYEDFLIPTNIESGIMEFLLRGGDGGKNQRCDDDAEDDKSDGGKGGTINVNFAIGSAYGELEPGGTIRFVVGKRGENQNTNNGGGAGGGGGTAILYKSPNATITDGADTPSLDIADEETDWILLAVAGGGGGAFAEVATDFDICTVSAKNGTGANTGTSGKGGGGNNDGGTNGNGGETGGGRDGGAGGGYLTNGDQNDEDKNGKRGGLIGGAGGQQPNCGGCPGGGFGYGGGGSGRGEGGGDAGGGGGGGFSGGGGGNNGDAAANNGGGAGSFINDIALDGYDIDGGGSTDDPDNGRIKYRFLSNLIVTDGTNIRIDFNNGYQDLVIPEDIDLDVVDVISFILKGGDGGKSKPTQTVFRKGGAGATTTADFKIGNAADELKPGGTIRFIIGEKGNSFTQQGKSGGAGGGAGGTAILYKGPDVDEDGSCSQPSLVINDNCWTVLAVAGGGGGAHARFTDAGGSGGPGNNDQNGNDGTGGADDGEGEGGTNGTSGETGGSDRAGGGGGYLPFGGGNPDPNKEQQGQPGVFTGGAGGRSIAGFVKGGFGYGGGGSGKIETGTNANAAGGGGGGFSGGGGGGNSGKGGGGGSWFNPSALFGDTNKNGTDGSPDNGLAYYNTYKTDDQVGGVQAPVAKCNPTIVANITGSENFPVTKDLVDNGSYDPNTPALDLTFTICSGTPGINEICAPINSFSCNLLGESRIRRLKVSNGVRDSYCSFVVEIEEGDVGTLTCPDPVTVYSAECENLIGGGNIRIDLRDEDFATCNDNLSYFIIRPDQSIDTDFTFDNNGGIGQDTFDFGTSTVVYQSNYFDEDEAPGFQSCMFTVTVIPDESGDVTLLECPDNIGFSLEPNNDCVVTIDGNDSPGPFNDFEPDYTDGDLTWIVTTGSGAVSEGVGVLEVFDFEIGNNIVEYTLSNCDDNLINSCSFIVEIEEGQFNSNFPPNITCVSSSFSNPVELSAYEDVPKNSPFITDQLVASATDDCYIASIELEGSFLINCNSVGDKERITITARDAQGRTDECQVWVRIVDDIGVTCPDDFTTSIPAGSCEVPFSNIVNPLKTTYLCGSGFNYTVDKFINGQFEPFVTNLPQAETFEAGLYRVNVTEERNDGVISSCSFEVTLQDTDQPEAVCKTINVGITNPPANIAELVAEGSFDNCSTISYSTDQSFTFDCANVGLVPIEVIITDESGNSNFCFGAVNIIDDVAPEITSCPQDQTIFIDTGSCDGTMPDLTEEVVATDNCGGAISFTQFPEEGTALDFGKIQAVEIAALDESGNASTTSCSFNISVIADVTEFISCPPAFTVDLGDGCTSFVTEDNYYPDFFECVPGLQVSVSNLSGVNISTIDLLDQTRNDNGYEFTGVGEYNFNYSVSISGNVHSCSTNIVVEDNQAPNAVCNNYLVTLPNDGSAIELAVSQLATASTDNCASNLTFQTTFTECNPLCVDFIASTLTLDCDNVGSRNYNIKVKDDNGNTSTCTATLTVIDNSTPTAVCQDQTIQLDASGNATINPESINNGSTSLCDLSFSLDQNTFDCTDVDNPVTVTLTATDVSMNNSTCTALVTVEDNIDPVAECQDQTVQLDANGEATIMASQVDNNSSDNCEDLSFNLDQTSFDCDDVDAPVSVELKVTDSSNLFATCTATITVEDNVAPVAECKNLTANLNNAGTLDITTDQIDNGSSDNCGAVTLSLNQTSFDCSEVGNNTVTLTVNDANGNSSSCNATVTVQDDTNPTALCQDVTVALDDNGEASITTEQVNDGSSDNCGTLLLSLNQTSFDCEEVGTVTVTLTVTDDNENSSTCTATITVEDNIQPTALCINSTIQLDNNGLATISSLNVDNGSTDNCEVQELSIDNKNFDCSNIGENTVTLTVLDVNGNSNTCTSTVTIEDNVAPLANCKNITVALDETGNIIVDGEDVDNVSWDACSIETYVLDINTFDCSDLGDNPVILTVTDKNGNTNSCNATITIVDNTIPDLDCLNPTVYLDANGQYTLSESEVFAGGTDNCGTINFDQLAPANLSCSDIGATVMVRVEANDGNGNGNSCVANVTVLDNINPNAVCNNATVTFNGESDFQLLASDLLNQNASSDNCDAFSIISPDPIITCDQLGLNVDVTIEIEDPSGNTGLCTSTITVEGLPCNWSDDGGIGCTENSVSFDTNGDIFTLTSDNCSAPYPYTEDQIAFVSQELCGDGEIIAYVTDVQGNGYGGLMIRETEAPNARKIALSTNRVNKLLKEVRVLDGYPAWPQQLFSLDKFWIKISRTGSFFRAYASVDGNNWIPYIFQNMQMDACVRVGLFTYSQIPNTTVTTTFENVSIGSGVPLSALPSDFAKSESLKRPDNVHVFPNPTTDVLNIDLSSFIDQEVDIQLYNNLGQLVLQQQIDRLEESFQQLNVSALEAGSFLLNIRVGDQQISKRIMIIND